MGSMVESSKVAEKEVGSSSFQTSTKTPLVASILESLRKIDNPRRGPSMQQPTQTFNRFEPLMGGEGADTQETVREADRSKPRMDEPAMESLNPSNEVGKVFFDHFKSIMGVLDLVVDPTMNASMFSKKLTLSESLNII
ncbi:hypothetical protein L6452_42183 [Arctium lappa]|uniref:Uncharacterized protein n=1 Tax=Arctium lappa TaxID=4217 RepID=A0ACB8XHZ1_ARCLA|nr:hypothetical protein L6452_42183 [Arctium lappa]